MTPDQIVSQGRKALQAGEAWLKANGYEDDAKKVGKFHAGLTRIANKHVKRGTVSALSVGDKPERP